MIPFQRLRKRFGPHSEEVRQNAVNGNVAALRVHHLNSPKFSKLGPRRHERQTVEECNESEAAFFSSITDFRVDPKDMKVAVFGDVAVMSYFPHVTFKKDGVAMKGHGRQTIVWVKTGQGWLVAHEHGTGTKLEE